MAVEQIYTMICNRLPFIMCSVHGKKQASSSSRLLCLQNAKYGTAMFFLGRHRLNRQVNVDVCRRVVLQKSSNRDQVAGKQTGKSVKSYSSNMQK
jgi:hypothetical protein